MNNTQAGNDYEAATGQKALGRGAVVSPDVANEVSALKNYGAALRAAGQNPEAQGAALAAYYAELDAKKVRGNNGRSAKLAAVLSGGCPWRFK